MGGVPVLDNGRWLITWGTHPVGTPNDRIVSISEVDPATGTAHLEIRMTGPNGKVAVTCRVYREDEAAVRIPRNLP